MKIMRSGKPAQISDFREGDQLTATIITSQPPQVLTEQEVQATLAPGAAAKPAAGAERWRWRRSGGPSPDGSGQHECGGGEARSGRRRLGAPRPDGRGARDHDGGQHGRRSPQTAEDRHLVAATRSRESRVARDRRRT